MAQGRLKEDRVSFLSLAALDALARLTVEVAPTYDLDKGMDMLLPNLLPSRGIQTLWLLDGCGTFITKGGACRPERIAHLASPRDSGPSSSQAARNVPLTTQHMTQQWRCSAFAPPASSSAPSATRDAACIFYLGANLALNGLNIFWAGGIVRKVAKRVLGGPKRVKVE